MEKTSPCPVRAEEIFRFALDALKERDVLNGIPEDECQAQTQALAALLPEDYLPDLYVDLPLTGGRSEGMAAVFTCYDRCYVNHATGGAYWQRIGVPSHTAPEDRDTLLVVRRSGAGAQHQPLSRKLPATSALSDPGFHDEELAQVPGLASLADFPVQFMKQPLDDGFHLVITTGPSNAKINFASKPYKDAMLAWLAAHACRDGQLRCLESATFSCGLPFWHPVVGYREWIVCVDIAAFRLTVKHGDITDCHAVLRISDRAVHFSGLACKPVCSYQWHITDNCDQRCKHCYLFAEDVSRECLSTPWDQLMHTLDAITEDAALRNAYPFPHISGGDPILHPAFWRFAEELHRRGLPWVIMGNPFHLNAEVCRRLYELGCLKYQMSLDGLQTYHDSMRKPGSFQATVDAVRLLNAAGIESQLMATVSRQNMEDVLQCMDLAVEIRLDTFVFARYCATDPEKAAEAYPSPQEYRDFLYRYYEKAKAFKAQKAHTRFAEKDHLFMLLHYELGDFRPPEEAKRHPDMIFDGCHLGQSCAILANGDVMACRRMESVIGNVWTENLYKIRTGERCLSYRDIRNIKKCRDCELLQWCRGCRAVGVNATGDLQAADPCCWK